METQKPTSDNIDTMVSDKFQYFVGGFRIDLPCVIIKKQMVYVQELYVLIDFLDNGGLNVRKVRFWHAFLKGRMVTIVLLDLNSGELLKRSHRLNNDTLPCDWVLVTDDIFKSNTDTDIDVINDYCENY